MPQPECQFDFRSEIVPLEQTLPQPDLALENIEVVTNRHLRYDGRLMRIVPANFAFNALILAQGEWASHSELSDFVALPVGKKEMTVHVNQLNVDLAALTGLSDAIQTRHKGNELERRFLPTLSFHDARENAENRLLQMGIIGRDEQGQPVFEDLKSRRTTLEALFKTYASDPFVLDALRRMLARQDETELPAEEIMRKYTTIKAALQSYAFSEQKDEALLRRATLGYYELFFNLYPRVKRIARKEGSAGLYDDAIQQSSMTLLSILIDFSKESQLKCIDFYDYVTTGIVNSVRQHVANEVRIAECLQSHEAALTRKVVKQIDELRQENQSEPSAEQIVKALQVEGMAEDRVRSCFWRLQNPPISFETAIKRMRDLGSLASAENALETELIEHMLDQAKCSINQKVMISLYYGVWLPSLAGSSVANRAEETFVYPTSERAFRKLQADEGIELHKDVGRVIGFQNSSVASGIDRALEKVRSMQVAKAN